MRLFGKLVAKLLGGTERPATRSATPAPQGATSGVTITITGPTGPVVEVSDAEVAERAGAYAYVLTTNPPALKTADQWWNEDTHKRRRREGSEKAYAWLLPFVPLDIVKLPQLQAAQERGPHGASAIVKELRAIIRAKRKARKAALRVADLWFTLSQLQAS